MTSHLPGSRYPPMTLRRTLMPPHHHPRSDEQRLGFHRRSGGSLRSGFHSDGFRERDLGGRQSPLGDSRGVPFSSRHASVDAEDRLFHHSVPSSGVHKVAQPPRRPHSRHDFRDFLQPSYHKMSPGAVQSSDNCANVAGAQVGGSCRRVPTQQEGPSWQQLQPGIPHVAGCRRSSRSTAASRQRQRLGEPTQLQGARDSAEEGAFDTANFASDRARQSARSALQEPQLHLRHVAHCRVGGRSPQPQDGPPCQPDWPIASHQDCGGFAELSLQGSAAVKQEEPAGTRHGDPGETSQDQGQQGGTF
ncbi:hypothetical protein MTO96_037429 [Rhipicephalus appendiculatus]